MAGCIFFNGSSVLHSAVETQVPNKVKKGAALKTKRLVTKKITMNSYGTISARPRSIVFVSILLLAFKCRGEFDFLFPEVFGATTRANTAYLSQRGKQAGVNYHALFKGIFNFGLLVGSL